jgi:hypothetical protein
MQFERFTSSLMPGKTTLVGQLLSTKTSKHGKNENETPKASLAPPTQMHLKRKHKLWWDFGLGQA